MEKKNLKNEAKITKKNSLKIITVKKPPPKMEINELELGINKLSNKTPLKENPKSNFDKFLTKKISQKSKENKSFFEKYQIYDSYNPLNTKFNALENFTGPKSKRSATDYLCLFPLLLTTLSLLLFLLLLINTQSLKKLGQKDFRGKNCGQNQLSHRPYLYYLAPSLDVNVKMCVTNCPNQAGLPICLYKKDGVTDTVFCYTQMDSRLEGTICLPTEPSTKKRFLEKQWEFEIILKDLIYDFYISYDFIFLSFLLGGFLAWFVISLMRRKKIIKGVIWVFILNINFQFCLFSFFSYLIYKKIIDLSCLFGIDKYSCGGNLAYYFYILIFVFLGIAVCYFFVIAFLFNRINLIISYIVTSLKITHKLSDSKYLPFLGMFVILILVTIFIFSLVMSFSIGEIKIIEAQNIDGNKVKVFINDYFYTIFLPGVFFFNLFLLKFVGNLINFLIGYMITIWFFFRKKETIYLPVSDVMKNTFKYHLGSLVLFTLLRFAFGYLINILDFLYKFIEKKNSTFWKILQIALMPVFFLYFKILRYFREDFYIQTYLWSENFWKSSRKAFFLKNIRNKHRSDGPDFLYNFILMQIKLSICLLTSSFYLSLNFLSNKTIFGFLTSEIRFIFLPCLFILIINYYITSIFFDSFEFVNQSVVQCYYIDEEMFVGVQRFTEKFVMDLMEYYEDDNINKKKIQAKDYKEIGTQKFKAKQIFKPIDDSDDDKSDTESEYEDDNPFKKKKQQLNFETDLIDNVESEKSDEDEDNSEEEGDLLFNTDNLAESLGKSNKNYSHYTVNSQIESESSDEDDLILFNDNEEKVNIVKEHKNESSFKLGERSLQIDNEKSVFKNSAQYLLENSKSYFQNEFNNKPPEKNNFLKSKIKKIRNENED